MIGSLVGSKSVLVNSVVGSVGGDEGSGIIAGVSRDALSGIYCPASDAEWTLLMAAAGLATGNPSSLHLMQEAAGNPADSIGTFTLTAAGIWTYQTAVPGWSRVGLSCADNAAATLTNIDVGLPNVGTQSHALLAYVNFPAAAPAAQRAFGAVGTVIATARISNTPRAQIVTGGGATASGAADPTNAVRPLILQFDRTGALASVTTNQEIVSTSNLGTVTGKQILWGANTVNAAAHTLMYLAGFHLGAAEWSAAQKRTLLTTLGFSVAF